MNKIVFVVLLLLSSICKAQTIDQTRTLFIDKKFSAKIAKAQQLIDSLMKEKNIPGLSISLGIGDQIIWSQAFGYADLENKLPVTLQSKFRIGSISKTLTSLALGKLMEENRIHLSDPIQKYVGRKYVYHGGSSIGGRSFLLVYPKDQMIVAITCNLSTNFDQRFILRITNLFL